MQPIEDKVSTPKGGGGELTQLYANKFIRNPHNGAKRNYGVGARRENIPRRGFILMFMLVAKIMSFYHSALNLI